MGFNLVLVIRLQLIDWIGVWMWTSFYQGEIVIVPLTKMYLLRRAAPLSRHLRQARGTEDLFHPRSPRDIMIFVYLDDFFWKILFDWQLLLVEKIYGWSNEYFPNRRVFIKKKMYVINALIIQNDWLIFIKKSLFFYQG